MSTSRVATWRFILETASVPVGTNVAALDWGSKWLLITRAGVFVMTLLSGLIGALLAVGVDPAGVNYWFATLAVVGIVIAHAANNMINDYFDLESGVDTNEYVRAQYAPHPILSGMVSKRTLATAILIANLVDLGIMAYLTVERGWPVVVFALGGAFISLFYVAPPIRLKHHGLGEPGVFIVWGPLMIGGTYFVATGGIPGWVWIATIPYAILVTTVLLGKHVDKIEPDREKGIHTLPVIIGERPAKLLTMGMMVAFYPILLGLVLAGLIGPWVLVVVLALPRLAFVLGIFRKPKPEGPPPDYPIWPLWFVGAAMIHTRLAGSFLVLGLIVNIILTGRHGYTNQQTTNNGITLPIDPSRSLPGLLTAAGYQTRAEGKMHFLPNRAHYGFEHMEILEDYYREAALHPEWGRPTNHGLGQNEMEPGIATVDENHSLTHWVVDRSINFLETRDTTRPFFLWTSFSKPHPPFDPCLPYWLQYQNAKVPEPIYGDWSKSVSAIPPGFLTQSFILNNLDRFSPALIRDIRRAYYALITQIDYNLGVLFARLREMNLLDNILILFTSDHGEMLGDHHLGAKSVFFEGSVHIPLIVCPPGFPDEQRGTACEAIATLADILITCANIAGISLPADYPQDGIDLLAMQRNEASRPLFVGECGEHFAILEDRTKYIYCLIGGGELLFDLKTDPYEQHNLMAEPSYAKFLTHLRQRLLAHMLQHHPETVTDGKINPQPVREVRDLRSRWPGHHSRELPEEVLH